MKHLVSGLGIVFVLVVATTTLQANTTQGHFRWRNDNGGEISASWRQTQDGNDTLAGNSRIRLRLELYESGPSATTNGHASLYYSTDNSNYTEITPDSTTNDWVLSRSSHFKDLDTTTEQLSSTSTGPFTAGVMVDSADTVAYSLAASGSTELEFSIAPTSHASNNTLYYFKVNDPTGGLSSWDRIPTLLYMKGLTALTGPALNVAFTTATLTGSVFPAGVATTVRFRVSDVYPYTDSVFATPGTVNGDSLTAVTASLTGLKRNTTYFYSISAAGSGYYTGLDRTFTTSDDLPDHALKFDGSIDYVEAPILTTGITNFTLEGWVKWNGATANNEVIFYNGYTGGSGYGVFLDHSQSDKVAVLGGGQFISDSRFTLPVGQWAHVALTCDNSNNWTLYVNGESQSLGNTPAATPDTAFFIGGHSGSSTETFNGTIDEVRFWNTLQDSASIRRNMHLVLSSTTPGLGDCYELNDTTGTQAKDLSGFASGGLTNFSFNTTDGWVSSTAPIGNGTSGDSSGFTGGTATLGTVSVVTTDAFDNPVHLVANELLVPPDSLPGVSGTLLSDRSWVITPYGTPGTFSTNLTFTVPSFFTANGAENPATYTLYHRGDNADGSWTPLVTGASGVTTTTITFNGISSFSQFMIGSSDASLAVEATDFSATTDVNSVMLIWKTKSEVDNAGYNILREDPGTGPFKPVASYAGNAALRGLGTSSRGKSYQFTDQSVKSGFTYKYRIQSVSASGIVKDLTTLTVTVGVPKDYTLYQNYPNPFNPSTTIRFDLKEPSAVRLAIYNILGQKVAEWNYGMMEAGRFNENIDMGRFASGVYIYRISALGRSGEKFASLKKMMLIK